MLFSITQQFKLRDQFFDLVELEPFNATVSIQVAGAKRAEANFASV
jgi:hypothetical protein